MNYIMHHFQYENVGILKILIKILLKVFINM